MLESRYDESLVTFAVLWSRWKVTVVAEPQTTHQGYLERMLTPRTLKPYQAAVPSAKGGGNPDERSPSSV
jgi:hypothetical protein